jgi:hypothetical protein
VHADFGGREAENEPAVASVDVGEFERVAEESAYFFGVVGVDQSVGAGDHGLPPWELRWELQGLKPLAFRFCQVAPDGRPYKTL